MRDNRTYVLFLRGETMDSNFYNFILTQKKNIANFEKRELESLIKDKAEKLCVKPEIIKILLSFYQCKDFEKLVQILKEEFTNNIKKETEIILIIKKSETNIIKINYNLLTGIIRLIVKKDFSHELDNSCYDTLTKNGYIINDVTYEFKFANDKNIKDMVTTDNYTPKDNDTTTYINESSNGSSDAFNKMLLQNGEKL